MEYNPFGVLLWVIPKTWCRVRDQGLCASGTEPVVTPTGLRDPQNVVLCATRVYVGPALSPSLPQRGYLGCDADIM